MIEESSSTASPTATAQSRGSGQRSPITLAFLFYLVTSGAIISACLKTLSANAEVTRESVLLAMVICGGLGMVIGFALGLLRFRRWSVAGLGMLSGAMIGIIAGALTRISAENFLQISFIAYAGSWMMIVSMCLAARYRSPSAGKP